MKVAAIILNFNGFQNTIECVESLEQCGQKGITLKIFVVDNNSKDNSVEKLSKIKGIILLTNQENLGYSAGNNVGIKRALAEKFQYILILNNDTFVDKSFLGNILGNSDKAEILAPKIYFAPGFEFHKNKYQKKDRGKVIWYAGGEIDWENILGKHLGVDQVDKGQFSKPHQIELATGAAVLIKNEVFEKIGLFDERYFLYLEDMDFSKRAQKAGFKIMFVPTAIVWHKNAASSSSGSKIQDYFITRNRLLFGFKYAKIRTKIALLKQAISEIGNKEKRTALFDFLFRNFGKGSYLK